MIEHVHDSDYIAWNVKSLGYRFTDYAIWNVWSLERRYLNYAAWNIWSLGHRFSDSIPGNVWSPSAGSDYVTWNAWSLGCRLRLCCLERTKPWTQVVKFMTSTVKYRRSVLENKLRTKQEHLTKNKTTIKD